MPLGHISNTLNIADVEHPLTHLNGLRVLHHLRQVRVDDLLEELVLGGAWWSHGDLDLTRKQQETRTDDFSTRRSSKQSGVYKENFYSWETSI